MNCTDNKTGKPARILKRLPGVDDCYLIEFEDGDRVMRFHDELVIWPSE
jgi:hypothetical protein